MKRLLLSTTILLAASILGAATINDSAVQQYVQNAMPNCPGGVVQLEPLSAGGPAGFKSYSATLTAMDTRCGQKTGIFVSPVSGQVILADVFALPVDARPIEQRVADLASKMLKKPVKASVLSTSLPDGVWEVGIVKSTPYGPFTYHTFVDASRRYLMVGRRGNLKEAPGKSLLDALNVSSAAARGNRNAKIEVLELSDFQCPTCRRAHMEFEPLIKKNLSRISYARLDLPLFDHHEWSFAAAMGARAIQKVAPESYWDYVDFIFQSQTEIQADNIDSVVKGFVEDHSIDWNRIKPFYESSAERQKLLDQVARALDNGVNGTPTFIINGQFIHYGMDGSYVRRVLETELAASSEKKAVRSSKR